MPEVQDNISPTNALFYLSDEADEEYWSQYCDKKPSQWLPKLHPNTPNSLFLLLRDVPLPSNDTMARYNSLLDYPDGEIRDIQYENLRSPFRTTPPDLPFPTPARPSFQLDSSKKTRYIRGSLEILGTSFWISYDKLHCLSLIP